MNAIEDLMREVPRYRPDKRLVQRWQLWQVLRQCPAEVRGHLELHAVLGGWALTVMASIVTLGAQAMPLFG